MVVRVHNVSNHARTAGAPVSVMIGGQKVRPGKSILVDDSVLNLRHRAMNGSRIWIGDLPVALKPSRTVSATTAPSTLDLAGVRARLAEMSDVQLERLSRSMTPVVEFAGTPSRAAFISRFSRAIFQDHRELDPEAFFWLGRWTRSGEGFVPKE